MIGPLNAVPWEGIALLLGGVAAIITALAAYRRGRAVTQPKPAPERDATLAAITLLTQDVHRLADKFEEMRGHLTGRGGVCKWDADAMSRMVRSIERASETNRRVIDNFGARLNGLERE